MTIKQHAILPICNLVDGLVTNGCNSPKQSDLPNHAFMHIADVRYWLKGVSTWKRPHQPSLKLKSSSKLK